MKLENNQTNKGVLMSAAIAMVSVGATLLAGEKWYVGIIIMACGVATIFLREQIKVDN